MNYLDSLFDLQGKVAVVMGGTGELCGVMALGLAQAGVKVVLVGRDAEKAEAKLASLRAAGGSGSFIPGDLRQKEAMAAILAQVCQEQGQVDILINGAGVNSARPFLEIEGEEWERIFDVNLGATVRACQVFGTYFLERGAPASIINLGSISGLNPLSRVFAYSASKAAVHNLTRNLAREWAAKKIRVNTLVPGFFPAEQNRKILDPSRVEQILAKTPAQRFGEPEELVGATLLLASSRAGGFLTGTELIVDGGFQAMTL
ncbi:MAG: SDR family oxidoreductase [Verrucomicrobiota bacterium]